MFGVSTCKHCMKAIVKYMGVWYHTGTGGMTYCYPTSVAEPAYE